MKSHPNLLTLLCLALAPTCSSFAATLASETPVHLKPDANAPVVATLPAGTSVVALLPEDLQAERLEDVPPDWIAIRHPGPFYGYAPNAAVGKDLRLRPGSIVRAEPSNAAPVLTMVGEEESAELIEVTGDWSRVVFSKNMIGFIRTNQRSDRAGDLEGEPDAETPPAQEQPSETLESSEPAPTPRTVIPPADSQRSEAEIDATPRVFQGYLMRTRRILGVGPKLDYQLVDESGRRIALLDLSRLLVTDPLDGYENRQVNVFGPVFRRPEVKDMIIRVETLRLGQ